MSGSEPKSGSGTSNSKGRQSSMLLRIRHRDGDTEEYYLANGLSIGRSEANTIQLVDDEAIGRSHARVEFRPDGTTSMVCVDAESFFSLGETLVREVSLTSGVQFKIGRTSFECVDGLRQPFKKPVSNLNKCPYCSSTNIQAKSDGKFECNDCHKSLLMLSNVPGFTDSVVIPAEFGDFSVVRFAARGGMGLVLEGKNKKDGVRVAIKLLLPNKSVSRAAAERFKQEVSMMRRVRHPRVVSLLNYGREGRSNYLVMEWADGNTLRDVISESIKAGRPITFERAFQLFEQMCKGIAAIHAAGIVHRDLKPSNVLIDADGNARISDLGIAKGIEASQTQLTQTGEVFGTSEYMAPEQFSAPEMADQRADLYSLGVMTYEVLTGSRPVGAWIQPSQINPTVPKEFDEVISKLLQRSPENRYGDINEVQITTGMVKQSVRERLADQTTIKSKVSPASTQNLTRNGAPLPSVEKQTAPVTSVKNPIRNELQPQFVATELRVSEEITSIQANVVFLQTEYYAILSKRRKFKDLMFVFGTIGYLLLSADLFLTLSSTTSNSISIITPIVFGLSTSSFAIFKKRTAAWGLMSYIGLTLLYFFIRDQNLKRLQEIEEEFDRVGIAHKKARTRPPFFWGSILISLVYMISPIGIILAAIGYFCQVSERKSTRLSIFALCWSIILTLTWISFFALSHQPPSQILIPETSN